jgi:large subunit ribosomal protein L22
MSTTEFTARHRFAGITARKARRIADMIRGRSVNEALELLQFAPQRGAAFYLKVVRSAIANASLDENVNINRLVISDCRADDGPLLSGRMRFRPGPQGRAMPFAKRLSHLTVKVRSIEDEEAGEKTAETSAKTSGGKGKKSSGAAAGSKSSRASSSSTAVAEKTSEPAPAGKPARKKASKKKPAEGQES